MPIDFPFVRLPQLSDSRCEALSPFDFDPAKESAEAFVQRFTSMGPKDRLKDFFNHGVKKRLLESVAYHKIAASPGGDEALRSLGKANEPGASAHYLLTELDDKARTSMLSAPLVLRGNGQIVLTYKLASADVTIELVLTPDCFHAAAGDIRMLSGKDIAGSAWMEKNTDGENRFLRQLVDAAPQLTDPANRATLRQVVRAIQEASVCAAPNGLRGDKQPDVALCRQLAACGLTPHPEVEDFTLARQDLFFASLGEVLKNVKHNDTMSLTEHEITQAKSLFTEALGIIEQRDLTTRTNPLNGYQSVYQPDANLVLDGTFENGVLVDGAIHFQWHGRDARGYNASVKDGKFCPCPEPDARVGRQLGPHMFPAGFAARQWSESEVVAVEESDDYDRYPEYEYYREFPGTKKE